MYSNLVKYVPNRKPPMGAVLNPYLPINRDIAAFWPMWSGAGNKVFDLSGNGISLDAVNTPMWVAGKYGPALQFVSGDTDYLEVTDKVSTILSPLTKGTVIVECTLATLHLGTIFSLADSAGTSDWGLLIRCDTGGLMQIFVRSSEDLGTWLIIQDTDNVVYSACQTIHIAVNQDGSGYKCYIDAKLQAMSDFDDISTDLTGWFNSTIVTNNRLRFGYEADITADNPFNGVLHYFSIYNRALSASEIAELYREPFCGFRWPNIIELASYVAAAPSGIPIFRRRRAG